AGGGPRLGADAQQMLERLEQRFELLVSRRPAGDVRHQSLRAALDWSYHLLPSALQQFFARLSVFRGRWSLRAAPDVCQEPRAREYLELRRDHSLVQADDSGAVARYGLLETLREYAAEQLAADVRPSLSHYHAQYYLTQVERADVARRRPAGCRGDP